MSDKLTVPGTDGCCKFVEAYFAGQEWTRDSKAKSGHIVYRIPNHHHNISIPKGYDRLVLMTFKGILTDDIGISLAEFRKLAGTPGQLKVYWKKCKREAR